jgi:hypothetical protein
MTEREMIASPELWAQRPKLPLIKRQPSGQMLLEDCGYLVEGCGLTVFIGNILLPTTGQSRGYKTIETLLAEWRVD